MRQPRESCLVWLLALWPLVPGLAGGETPVPAWERLWNGPANGGDGPSAVAVDSSNNVIIAGGTTGFGGSSDSVTIKYSSAGQPIWTNFDGGSVAYAVAVDSSDDIIVTGYSTSSATYEDYLTIKYSSAGLPLWTNRYSGSVGAGSLDEAKVVAVDRNNDVIVTGYAYIGVRPDYVTIKYSSSGMPLWTNRYDGPGRQGDFARAMAIDDNNNVIVTGRSMGNSGMEFGTIKYSSAGVPLWTNRYQGPGSTSEPYAVATDSSNSVIVTGFTMGSSGGIWDLDYATVKYSATGQPLWTNVYSGLANTNDSARALAVDESNNITVTGGSDGSTADLVTIRYSSAGTPLWTNTFRPPAARRTVAVGIGLDLSGNPIVTGISFGSNSPPQYVMIKYSREGTPVWTNYYCGPAGSTNFAAAAAVDHAGAVIVTGRTTGVGGASDFATIKYGFPLLISYFRLDSGMPRLILDNLRPGAVTIEISTNLADWVPVFTNIGPDNTLIYSDPNPGDASMRFYRSIQFR